MNDIFSFVYDQRDPKRKTKAWAQEVATLFRMWWTPLIGADRAAINRAIMYGQNSIQHIKDSFQDEEFKKNTIWTPLPYLETFVNTIVEEITQNPPRTEVKAQDPFSILEKEEDVKLLRSRKILERDVSKMQRGIGLPDYKLPYDDFNGNVEEFDEMQLDENDPEDMDIFKNNFHKLWYEIGGQAALNVISKNNKFDEGKLRTIVKDAFAYKAGALFSYVDQMTGEIKQKYTDPSLLMGVWGKTNDGSDDTMTGWLDGVTVNQWLSMVGNEFNFEEDWKNLLWGINYYNGTQYTGFERGGRPYTCLGNTDDRGMAGLGKDVVVDNLIAWNNAYMFKVWVGYMEFPTWEATSTFKYTDDDEVEEVDYDYELTDIENKKGYQVKSKYQQVRYRMYFLGTSSVTQFIFGFQKVYFQNILGQYDEYSLGTIHYWQEQGQSAVELSSTFLNVANFAYYRFLWLLWHTKPLAEEYVLDEILTLAKAIQRETPQTNGSSKLPGLDTLVEQAIQQQRRGHYRLRIFPKVDGKTIPMLPQDGRKQGDGGIDPTAIVMQSITQWAEQRISAILGFSPMRTGANPPSRESLKTEENVVAASQNATGYLYRIPQYIKEQAAITSLNYISDIIQYEGTLPYKWLEKALGSKVFKYLQGLKKDTGHRLGIFVSDINIAAKRQRLANEINQALAQKLVTIPQAEMLMDAEDPKLAVARLFIMQRQADKRVHRQQMQILEQQQQNAMQLEQEKQKTASIPANAQVQSAQIGGSAQVESARIQSEGRLQVKQLQTDAEPTKQAAKSEGDIMLAETENNLKLQQPLTSSQGESE